MILQFEPLSSAVDATFWSALADQKINTYKLDSSERHIFGSYIISTSREDRIPSRFCVNSTAFDNTSKATTLSLISNGILKNTNTIEEFRELDKQQFLGNIAQQV